MVINIILFTRENSYLVWTKSGGININFFSKQSADSFGEIDNLPNFIVQFRLSN